MGRAQSGPSGYDTIDLSEILGKAGGVGDEGQGHGGMFEEILGRMRGGGGRGGRSRGPRPGRDVEANLTIPFETAVRGGETTIALDRDGVVDTLNVKIPPEPTRARNSGFEVAANRAKRRAPAGSLIVHVEVEPHRYYTREGRDLFLEVPITIGEAVLGAKVEVPTFDGSKTLPIPSGSSSGQKLRLRGLGAPATTRQPAGDLFVVLKVVVPKKIDDESRTLIERYAERNPQNPRSGLW